MRGKVVGILLMVGILTFRLLDVPPGIETDEGSIANQALSIATTGRDINGRSWPVFFLSADRVDWKQPILIYEAAVIFKLFGPTLFNFKLVNVGVTVVAAIMLWLVAKEILGERVAYLTTGLLVMSPMVFITARLGNESVQPVFFATVWLWGWWKFERHKQERYLIVMAVALGLGFYCFKGMRLFIPPWVGLTSVYLMTELVKDRSRNKIKKVIKNLAIFCFMLSPFLLITPILEHKYAGAVFDHKEIGNESYRHYLYYWLENLGGDLWWTKGDIGRVYEMNLFGVVLLASAPWWFMGVGQILKEKGLGVWILGGWLSGPMLFGLAGSVDYGHRLVAMVPMYVLICGYGIKRMQIWMGTERSVKWSVVTGLLIAALCLNLFDFWHYYFNQYPRLHQTREAFGNRLEPCYRELGTLAKKAGQKAYIEEGLHDSAKEGNSFFERAYLGENVNLWKPGDVVDEGCLVLTRMEKVEGYKQVSKVGEAYLQQKQ